MRPLCMLLLMGISISYAQLTEFDQWAQRVNWDGTTPWQFYINAAPGAMGPSALPVPRMQKGLVSNQWALEIRPEYHKAPGDKTYDLFSRLYVPVVKERVSLEFFWVVYERYNMDPELRNFRNARTPDGKGAATGDLHISTIIQLLRDHHSLPDVTLNISIKTALGGQLDDARFTDAPGYYFDVSAGNDIKLGKSGNQHLRWHVMAGFYVWQIYTISQRQNDAFSFGGGLDWVSNKWMFSNTLSGFIGYINDGDQPIIWESTLQYNPGKLSPGIGYRNGLNDYPYQSYYFSLTLPL